jgi:AcrR family transcriptional regulator
MMATQDAHARTRTRRSARPGLDRERVLRAALALIDREGLEALTMRHLGAELGVEAMSIYNHVPDKEAILDGVCEIVLAEMPVPAGEGTWTERLRRGAIRFRELGLRHRNAFPLFATRPIGAHASSRALAESTLAVLRDAGFDPASAIMVYRTLVRYVLGFVLAEVAARPPERRPGAAADAADPLFADMLAGLEDDPEVLFTFGLDVLLDGFAARLRERPAEGPD